MLLSSCAQPIGQAVKTLTGSSAEKSNALQNKVENAVMNNGSSDQTSSVPDIGTYNEGVVLVKYDKEMTDSVLSQLSLSSAEPLYTGSKWYRLELYEDADTVETVEYLRALGVFESVDYDYIMTTGAEVDSADVSAVSSNPEYKSSRYFDILGVTNAWKYLADNDKNPGGSSDVVVAVIDTGVDYTHLDLRNNIWVNPLEIPGNGIDDDGNGYVDDVYGWNFVGDDNDPMDDNGHGTHVAGIIAAENNDIGSVGIAYDCKIMVLKAGNSSGYFNNADIAEAVMYAYMNGASVINMSFGGSLISLAVEDALTEAYSSCVLVAAAGNDGACNQIDCIECKKKAVSYPAALPYVLGVMSVNALGWRSGFSNYDHYPHNSTEYDIYAVGENVTSTWPGNKYACLSGTSMAAPTVSAIAALLRSSYPDRETYSTKYLISQIVNTSSRKAYDHSIANAYDALAKLPTPNVNLYDCTIDDSTSISSANNGDGVIQSGETVRIFVSLQNRGGVASNVKVTLGTTDKYFNIKNSRIEISDIGTYSIRNSGDDKYFEIEVSPDCPNDYLIDFDISFEYQNGLNEKDTKTYSNDGSATFNVSRGFYLPSTFTEDTVYTNDRLYIVGDDVIIPDGITVTFKEGCEIRFYDDRDYYNSPVITVYGTLKIEGTAENMVKIAPSERLSTFICQIVGKDNGCVDINYADTINLTVREGNSSIYNSPSVSTSIRNTILNVNVDEANYSYQFLEGNTKKSYEGQANSINVDLIDCCIIGSFRDEKLFVRVIENCFIDASNMNGICLDTNQIEGTFRYNTVLTQRGSTIYATPELRGYGSVNDNYFITGDDSLRSLIKFERDSNTVFANNTFSPLYQKYASQIISDYYDSNGNPTVDVYGSCSDITKLWPYVVSVELFDKSGKAVTSVGKEEITVRVTFNRPMDKDAGTYISFGTKEPYADYLINSEFISDTVWEGSYTLKAEIENGQNFIKVNNAWAAEDKTKTVFGECFMHEFTIDTTAALSMNLQAETVENGVKLTWFQDDYDTLLGYNIYRSEDKDGKYVKLNPTVLLSTDEYFIDDNAEPGKTYWYTYTVVLSDFSESRPAGKVQGMVYDSIAPNVYHTPVNQGYQGNNLVISCSATDNISVKSATLYYRTVGDEDWKSLAMSKQSDKFSATIFGSELTLEGLEYYITVSDGVNLVYKGSADAPYVVTVKDASAISRIGDVNGDGTVTTLDALMLIQAINDELILTDDEFTRADLNGDGILNSSEALRILQYINGNVSTLEME